MFFGDNHQADRTEWCEYCAARTDHHVDITAADAMPLVVPLAVRQAAVLNRHAIAEAAAKLTDKRWCQRDFRNQDQNAAAGGDHMTRQPEIELRFPAGGDAVEQHRTKRTRSRRVLEAAKRVNLLGRQSRRAAVRAIDRPELRVTARLEGEWIPHHDVFANTCVAAIDQRANSRGADALLGRVGGRETACMLLQELECRGLFR